MDAIPSLPSSTLNSLLWLGPDAIINAHDPVQKPGQTQIFYKPGQTHFTQTKHDPVDRIAQPGFNPDCYESSVEVVFKRIFGK